MEQFRNKALYIESESMLEEILNLTTEDFQYCASLMHLDSDKSKRYLMYDFDFGLGFFQYIKEDGYEEITFEEFKQLFKL